MTIEQESKFMQDYWMLRKKFYIPEESETFWQQLIEECDRISKKYNSDFANELLIVCADDIDRRFRQQTGNRFVDGDPVKTVYERMRKRR